MPCTTTSIRCIEHHHHPAVNIPFISVGHPLQTPYTRLYGPHTKTKTPTISHLPLSLISLSCFLSCSRILFPPLCCRLMIHFFQMREALVVIGSVRGCIQLVGNLRQKRNIKKRRSKNHKYLRIFFNWDLRSRGIFFFGDLSSIYEDCEARNKKRIHIVKRKEDWYFFLKIIFRSVSWILGFYTF